MSQKCCKYVHVLVISNEESWMAGLQMVMGRPIRVDVAEDRPQKGSSTGALLTLAHAEDSCRSQSV